MNVKEYTTNAFKPHKLHTHIGRAALILLVVIMPLMTFSCSKPEDDPDEDYEPFEWRWQLQPTDEPTADLFQSVNTNSQKYNPEPAIHG